MREFLYECVGIFYEDIENFAKFISYVKPPNALFAHISNFRQNLDEVRKFLGIFKNSSPKSF